MKKQDNLIRLFQDLRALWQDRDSRIVEAKAALQTVPARFRASDIKQKRSIIGIIVFILATQIYFLVA